MWHPAGARTITHKYASLKGRQCTGNSFQLSRLGPCSAFCVDLFSLVGCRARVPCEPERALTATRAADNADAEVAEEAAGAT